MGIPRVILGTAGHVDHGKSALVTALTGRPMDGLVEERRRGITIELHFAPLPLEGLGTVGIVDVPGHEDLVRTMVAGASGIDGVLLVVDAQQGIQPQTLEHLAVVEQLGIPVGIPVLTKADLADPEWLGLVREDLIERLGRSPVRFESPVVTSAVTGLGIELLRQRIRELAGGCRSRGGTGDILRLPVDRIFSVPGAGSVVTGTVWSGSVSVGESVRLEPGGRIARIRAIEQFGVPVERALPGARTAIGLAGMSHDEVRRGQVAVAADAEWVAGERFDALLRLIPEAPRPLAARSRVRMLLGTAEVMARVYPQDPIQPGGEGLARLVLEGPALVRGGDPFVLRSYSPVATIGGGRVLDPAPPRRAGWPEGIASGEASARLVALVRRQPGGRARARLSVLLGVPPAEAEAVAIATPGLRMVADRVVAEEEFQEASTRVMGRVVSFHARDPSARGISLETLRQSLGALAWLADTVLRDLAGRGQLVVTDGLAMVPGHAPASGGGEDEVRLVVAAVQAGGLEPPSLAELGSLKLRDLAGALRIAASRQLIEPVERDRYFSTEALSRFREAIRRVGEGGAEVTPAALREQLGLSRKFLIPLLEWADRSGITWRDHAGVRRLRRDGPAA
jgi:selenocysteine-specific elongation factor